MKKTIGAIALAAAFFVLTACGGCEKNEVPMDFQGEVLLNFQIVSDIHYNTEYDPAMNEKFRSVCQYNAENFSERKPPRFRFGRIQKSPADQPAGDTPPDTGI